MSIADTKTFLRDSIRQRLRGVAADERARLSRDLCDLLRGEFIWQRSMSIGFFAPRADEPDVSLLLEESLAAGKAVRFPRHDAETGRYVTCQVTSRADLVPGRFGILEPMGHCPVVPLKQLDFILVPGIAFDLAGRRLGRGKGFFDRLLAEVRGHKCGVCFDAQVVPAVPAEPHDIHLDSILTPTRWHACPRAA